MRHIFNWEIRSSPSHRFAVRITIHSVLGSAATLTMPTLTCRNSSVQRPISDFASGHQSTRLRPQKQIFITEKLMTGVYTATDRPRNLQRSRHSSCLHAQPNYTRKTTIPATTPQNHQNRKIPPSLPRRARPPSLSPRVSPPRSPQTYSYPPTLQTASRLFRNTQIKFAWAILNVRPRQGERWDGAF